MGYDNTNKGAVWKGKSDNPRAPVLSGKIDVNGVEYRISMWNNTSSHPQSPEYDIVVTSIEEVKKIIEEKNKKNNFNDFDDDIPF